MTYEEAKAAKAELEAAERAASARVREFPRGPDGLTPDHVKRSPSFTWARNEYDAAFSRLRNFNQQFLSVFGKEYKADCRQRLENRYAEQCEKFPLTREIPLERYVKRNLRHVTAGNQLKDYAD